MTNFEALMMMPLTSFANMVFHVARNDCKNLNDFEKFLEKKFPEQEKEIKTCELVRELEMREGIQKIWVEPEDTFKLLVTSPTLILVIAD